MDENPTTSAPEPTADSADVEKNKGVAVLAYILFFVPLIAAKESKFAMYHANQGLILLILAIAVSVLGSIIPLLGWFIILPFGSLLVLVLWIIGIMNASSGKMKPLPLIGGFTLLK